MTTKFKIGDKVRVVSDCASYNQIGVVDAYLYGYNRVQVRLNNGSVKQYNEDSLRLLEANEGVNNMAVKGNYDVAFVKFLQGVNTTKEYAFALFEKDGSICVGD